VVHPPAEEIIMAKKGQYKKNAKPRTLRDRAYDGSPARKKARAARNNARRDAIRSGKVQKGDGSKHIDHKKPLSKGGAASKSNTRIVDAKSNMSRGGKLNKGRKRK
jgi:hypothetical protein